MKQFALAIVVLSIFLVSCSTTRSVEMSLADKNLHESNAWLKINLKNAGVLQTRSGLQYRVLSAGNKSACSPNKTSVIKVNYNMRLARSNYELDSSYKRNMPAQFSLKNMILGWQEGVPMMKVGDSWEFYLPPHLAYGSNGSGRLIQPNVVLTSRVDLLGAQNCKF